MSESNEIQSRGDAIVAKRRLAVLEHLGLAEPGLVAGERKARDELQRLTAERAKQLAAGREHGPEATAKLVGRARTLTRSGGTLHHKPDPFGPVDVRTDGPLIEYGVPTATATVCSLSPHSILDTSANQAASLSPDEADDNPLISQTAEFDPTPGVNEARFSIRAGGDRIDDQLLFQYGVGFRFNFIPPAAGSYAFAPVASLSGAWLAGGLSAIGGRGALRLALRVRTTQFGAGGDFNYAYNDVVLVDSDESFGAASGSFDFSTPTGGIGPLVQNDFEADLLVHVVVTADLVIRFEGLGFVDVDAMAGGLGLAVPEVHAFTVDCFQMSLDTATEVGKPLPAGPAIPGRPGVDPGGPGPDPIDRPARPG